MEKNQIFKELKTIIPEEKIKQDEPMKNHTSFKIGGPADFFIKISKQEELIKVMQFAKKKNIQLTVVGNGSNLLVSDKGIRGIVIKIDMKEILIEARN